jgi:hypothetical protein
VSRRLRPDVRQRYASHRDSVSISQNLAFDFDDATDPTDDPDTRVEELVRTRASRELKGSHCGDPQHSPSIGLVTVAGRSKPAGLSQQFDQYDRGDDRITRKVPLKVPVVRMRDAETAGGLTRHEIDDFLDEPHGWAMREEVDCGATCSHELCEPF